MKTPELSGKRFGRLLVVARSRLNRNNHNMWKCLCDCGQETNVGISQLLGGHTKSCGCLRNDTKPRLTHGKSGTKEYRLWCWAHIRAIDNSLPFSIVVEDIIVPEFCPCCNVGLEVGKGRLQDSSPTLDRLQLSNGYTKDNVWVICYKCNRMKSNSSSPEELENIAAAWRQR